MLWERLQAGGIAIVAIQASDWSCSAYLDLGLKLDPALPTHYRDIVARLQHLAPDRCRVEEILRFGEPPLDSERVEKQVVELGELLAAYGLPWLDRLDSLASIRSMYDNNEFSGWVTITLFAKRVLGVEEEAVNG